MSSTRHLKNRLKDQGGQIAIEYILLSVIFAGIALGAKNLLVANNTLGSFVQKPWELVAGMIESGVWEEPKKARASHPGLLNRHRTLLGESE